MKKKLLLMATLIAVLVFAFALTAFADDIIVSKTESDVYGTVIQLNADPGLDNASQYVSTLKNINDAGTDKTALCILTDGAETPSYYVFPASYIVLERADGKFDLTASDLAAAVAELNEAKETKYYESYSTYSSGGGKRFNGLVRFEFTSDVTTVDDGVCCMRSYSTLKEVRFNYEISMPARDMFKSSSSLVTVVGFENVDATNIGHATFMGCTSLETVSLPTDIVRISSSMFWGCRKITITNLAECTQLTTIGSSAFQDTSYLNFVLPDTVTTIEKSAFQSAFKDGDGGSFTIGKNSQLVTIGDSAFEDCRKMPANVYIPSTVTSIGKNAFLKCYTTQTFENLENCQITTIEDGTFQYVTALTTIKIPKTVTTIGSAFADNNNLTLVYIPSSVTSIADTFTGGKPTNAVFIYTGFDASVLSTCSKIAGANVIQASNYDSTVSYSGINLVVGYSSCVAYNNGNHGETSKTIEVTSYTDVIKVHQMCLDCQNALETDEIAPLFTCLGYSTAEFANGGISVGYNVNKDAISEYETISGVEVSYGLFAGTKQGLGTNDVIGEDGKAVAGAITAGFENSKYSFMFIKMFGFNEDNKDTPFAIGAYVAVDNGEGKEYSYLQNEKPQNGAK
ncbi:MAG: leucine-rich repeat domain-containing protein, partial [Clostridia bacterium]|nr:leucine-rich repeat domain-containing protein [Clostridia bacterium]